MFDSYARSLLIDVDELEGLTGDAIARALSRAYLAVIHLRTNGAAAANEAAEAQSLLRRLASSLLFQVILNDLRSSSERKACAFVAAEAISLLADFHSIAVDQALPRDTVYLIERISRLEAALLYLYAEFDACAAGVLNLPRPEHGVTARLVERTAAWSISIVESLCRMQATSLMNSQPPFTFDDAVNLNPVELEADTIGRLYAEIGLAASDFANWLVGGQNEFDTAITRLDRIIAALAPSGQSESFSRVGSDYSRVFFLATLLRLCLPDLGKRALCHIVPTPPDADPEEYRQYLVLRATGTMKQAARPLLWPSAMEYLHACIVGTAKHAVVTMPTGSGKSFIGELAASQALASGWVLYLAPTNALTEQIRLDLKSGLEPLKTEIVPFITADALQTA